MALALIAAVVACLTAIGAYVRVASAREASLCEPGRSAASVRKIVRRAMLASALSSLLVCAAGVFILSTVSLGLRLLLAGAALVVMMSWTAFVVGLAAFPIFKQVSGRHWDKSAFVFRLVVSAWTVALPVGLTTMALGAGVNLAANGDGLLSQLASLGVLAALIGLWTAQWPALRLLTLPGRIAEFPIPEWEDECFALARRMNARLRDLLLLRTGRARVAGAFYLGSGRITITDDLVAALDETEFLAVMAHELAHISQRWETVRAASLLGASSVACVCIIAAIASIAGLSAVWSTAAAPAILIPYMGLVRLKRRHEDEADDAAIEQVGARPLIRALTKTYAINGRLADNIAGVVHRGLMCRLARIASRGGLGPDEVSAAIAEAGVLQPKPTQVFSAEVP